MGDGNAANIFVGVVGGIFRAAEGATLPTGVSSSAESTLLANGFAKAGYAATDGVVQSMGTSTSNVVAWGGDTVKTVQTEHTLSYEFKPIEHSDAALKMYYGESATTTYVEINGQMLPVSAWVIVVRDGNKRICIVIPRGQVTDRGDVEYAGEDAAGLPVTITCYPDVNGIKAYLYIGDVAVGAPTVTAITPSTGTTAGGVVAVLTGTNFIDVTGVFVGANRAVAFSATSATSISIITPARAAGATNVTVKTQNGGTSITGAGNVYTYA